MMSIFIFAVYFFLFSYLLFRCIRNKSFAGYALAAFWIKILFGCLYGYSSSKNMTTSDTWWFFNKGLHELPTLKHHFFRFIQLKQSGVFDNESGFRYEIMIKISAVFSLLSGGRYYVNLIFYNWIVFWGGYYLLKFMAAINRRNIFVFYLLIFFFPPFVFWTSGFHRDGFCFAALAIALYHFNIFLKTRNIKSILTVVGCTLAMLIMRNFWGISFVYAAALWAVLNKSKRIWLMTVAGVLLGMLLFWLTSYLPESFNLPLALAQEQWAFNALHGNSLLPLDKLYPTVFSYAGVLPQVLDNLFLKPYPAEIHGLSYLFSFFEMLTVWAFAAVAVFQLIKKRRNDKPSVQLVTLGILVMIAYLVIGYTIPFLGAIVRYRAPFELLLLLILICNVSFGARWHKVFAFAERKFPDSGEVF